ncbi:diguanylate cyclase [Candidatus Omnitrophota bacterium]
MNTKINILIVAKNENDKNSIDAILDNENYNLSHASSGGEALKLSEENRFHIVIADLNISGMTGVELIERLKTHDPNICIIVAVAQTSEKTVVDAIRQGAYDYITKPLNNEEVKIVLSRAAERQRLLEEAGKKEYYRELSIIDGLTGVYNYRYFYEMLPREIERAKRYPQEFSLLMLDIDGFKAYNDTHGHLAGDKLLRQLGHFLSESTRAVDMVFRYGGEEFAILLPQTPQTGAAIAAQRIMTHLRRKISVTVSIGIASYPMNAQSKEELIEKADRALYQAKCLGKDRVCIYGKEKAA